jgi:magnesium-transporting ATPase (P-type)
MSASDHTGSPSSTVAEILAKLGTNPKTGLNPARVQERLTKYGPNALAEEKKSALRFPCLFLGTNSLDD